MTDYNRIMGLEGKTAVISGGAVNIGRAVSLRLAEFGVKTAVIYNSSRGPAEELVEQINSSGGTSAAFRADVGNADEVEAVFKLIVSDERFQAVDIMVNNSGIFSMYPQKDLEVSEWDRLFSINVRGLYLCARAAAKHMRLNDKTGAGGYLGSIINMASINALHPGFGFTAHYDATKGAVYSYTRSLAAELGPEGIRVNAVAPGLVDSEGLRKEAGPLAEMVEGRNPLRTAGGETRLVSGSDVADAVVYLASAMASSLTGETIVVDRGYLLT